MAVSRSGSHKTTSRTPARKPSTPAKKPSVSKPKTTTTKKTGTGSGSSSTTANKSTHSTSSTGKFESKKAGNSAEDDKKAEDKAKTFSDSWNDSAGEAKAAKDGDTKTGKGEDSKTAKTDDPGAIKDKNSGEQGHSRKPEDIDPTQMYGREFSDRMQSMAKDHPEKLDAILQQSFDGASPEQLARLKEQAAGGTIPMPGSVSFVEPSQLKGAQAAYSPDNNGSILLSSELRNDPQEARRAFTEEMGHHLDAQFSDRDSTGDEGQIFQEGLEQGKPLEKDRVEQIRRENDKGTAIIDGREKPVENRETEQKQPGYVDRYENAQDAEQEGRVKLREAEKELKSFNERFDNARDMAQRDVDYDARYRGGRRTDLSPYEAEYEGLLRNSQRTDEQNQRLKDLGQGLDSYYRRSGNRYTSLAQKQYDLEQSRNKVKGEISQAEGQQTALKSEVRDLTPEQRAKVQEEYRAHIQSGERAGHPELNGAQQKSLQVLDDPKASAEEKRQAMWDLRNSLTRDRDADPGKPSVADELARRMQSGDQQAYDALKNAAKYNPRARQLMDNLELTDREKAGLQEQISGLRGDYNSGRELREQFLNRGAAADYISQQMNDYIANHTSEEQLDPERKYGTPFQNPGAQEKFLQGLTSRNPELAQTLKEAKLGQSRMDLLEGSPEARESAYQKLQQAMQDPEQAQTVREHFAGYEGNLYQGASLLQEKGNYDMLAALGQAKDNTGTFVGVDYYLRQGGRDAAEAVQRQYRHLNSQGRQVAGDFLEGSSQLKDWVGADGVKGLAGTVADSVSNQPIREFTGYDGKPTQSLDVRHRLEALSEARTDDSRAALSTLAGDERKMYSDTVGHEALEALEADPQGRQHYFEALRSDDDGARRNALGLYVTPTDERRGYSQAEKEEFLSSTVQALGKTKDSELRGKALERVRSVGVDDPSFHGKSAVSFEARADAYGALLAQSDKLNPNSDQSKELRVLANDMANADHRFDSRYSTEYRNEQMQHLNDAVLGDDSGEFAKQVGAADAQALALADARLRHSGQDGLVQKLDDLRQNDPRAYQAVLQETIRSDWPKQPGQLGEYLEQQSQKKSPAASESKVNPQQQADLQRRLGSNLMGTLQGAPTDAAGQMAQDVRGTEQFATDMAALKSQRETLKRQGQDTSEIDRRMAERTAEHEASRFDSQGLQGRLDAVESLGDQYQQLQQIADRNGLNGRDFDQLLMKSAEMQRLGNQQGLNTLMDLAGQPGGLKPSEMNLMMDVAGDMSSSEFNSMLSSGSSASQVRDRLSQSLMQDMQSYARGEEDRWFSGPGALDTRGQRITDFLVAGGKGGELLYNSEGGGSAFDRMMLSNDPSAQRNAQHLAQSVLDKSRRGTPLHNAGQVALEKLNGADRKESALDRISRLGGLRGNLARLSGDDQSLQARVNADVSELQTEALAREKVSDSFPALSDAKSLHESLLKQIHGDQTALPKKEAFKSELAELEASRQVVLARQDQVEARMRGHELERQRELLLSKDMNHRQIEAMMDLFINSPTDSLSIDLEGKFGVELQAAMFGSAEAYVKGSLGFQVQENEDGKFSLTFSGAYGAGAGAQAGMGPVSVAAGVDYERFGKHVMNFANKEQVARFISQKLWDAQSSLGLNPEGPRPEYKSPIGGDVVGSKYTEKLKLGAVEFQRQRVESTTSKDQPKPWLAAEQDRKQETEIRNVSDSLSAQVDLPGGRTFGLSMTAEDQIGDKNAVGNGTTVQLALELGLPMGASQGQVQTALVDRLISASQQMDPEGGWRHGKTDEEIHKKLTENFTTGQLKVNAKGVLELNFSSNQNLMLDPADPNGPLKMNGGQVFQHWISDMMKSDNSDATWQMNNVRSAAQLEANFSQRARYGTGIANVFAEVGITAKYRDATTLLGSMLHGRFMLYGHTQNVSMDRDQIQELQKDGIIQAGGRDRGKVNTNALNYSLGRMRADLMSLYESDEFRQQSLRMPDGSIMTRERFQENIDTYLLSARDSVYGGAEKSGVYGTDADTRRLSREAFESGVSLDSIRQAQQLLESRGLMKTDEVESYQAYLDFVASAETQPGLMGQMGRNIGNDLLESMRTRAIVAGLATP